MKKHFIAASTLAITSASAFAADLPMQSYKSPPRWWPKSIIGLAFMSVSNGGYGWGTQDPLILFSNRFDRSSFNISGGMVGGTVGAQIQQGYVVLGLEGDLDWANIKGSGISNPSILGMRVGHYSQHRYQHQRRWDGQATRRRRHE